MLSRSLTHGRCELSDITGPVLLWHGGEDVFIPASHTQWLPRQIRKSELRLKSGAAHFGAIEILPEILSWVLHQATGADRGMVPPPDRSERLRVDHAKQPMVDAGLGNVRVSGVRALLR